MTLNPNDIDALRSILENVRNPEVLDTHPWAARPFVREAVSLDPGLAARGSGQQLIEALGGLFRKMMPGTPPRHGKRLDTRWGEFGILAAMYFAPLQYGLSVPSSLRDAWGRIDQSILHYVFGSDTNNLTADQVAAYKLVGGEPEVAPNSTLSDWHRKGIQRLAEVIQTHEQYLAKQPSDAPAAAQEEKPSRRPSMIGRTGRRVAALVLILLTIVGLVFGGLKARRVVDQARLVWDDANRIQGLISSKPTMENVRQAGSDLATLRQDFTALRNETEPFLWLGPWLDWVPVYGGDLAAAPDLVAMTDSLLAAAEVAYQGGLPLLDAIDQAEQTGLDTAQLTQLVLEAQPQWLAAQRELDAALAARQRVDAERLSPRVRELVGKLDPLLPLMQDGLAFAVEFPKLAGATAEGPKTYLLLAQNEDELRPTGGFITAAGSLLIQDGRVSDLTFADSGDLDNWEKPYPAAPWQLQQYMNSPVLIFRDSNWFTDYPASALYAEYLYSHVSGHSVDGVIAFDQQMLVKVLQVTGPIEVENASYPVTAGNVIEYMRTSKTIAAENRKEYGYDKKVFFIENISSAVIEKIFSGDVAWEKLARALLEGLNERHILVQMDDPVVTSILARRHWDGAVRPGNGDFLMVVDSNVGFNKTNTVVQASLFYDVDLTTLESPTGQLVVDHQNNATRGVPCIQWNSGEIEGEDYYPINRCYWDYLRVYTLSGSELLGASVQTVPGEWMILKRTVPPQVDILEEIIEGVRGFGALKVVPGGESLASNFRFSLPAAVVETRSDSGEKVYRLKIQKQPGTLAVPVTIRLHLPNGATVRLATQGAVVQGQNIQFETTLVTDVEFEVVFVVP